MSIFIKPKSTLEDVESTIDELKKTYSNQNCTISLVEYKNVSDWITHLENLKEGVRPFDIPEYNNLKKLIGGHNLPLVLVRTDNKNVRNILQKNGFKIQYDLL